VRSSEKKLFRRLYATNDYSVFGHTKRHRIRN